MAPIADLASLLRTMEPKLNRGTYVFASVREGQALPLEAVVASIREPEGLSVVIEESAARGARLQCQYRCAWITLSVNSDLDAVGLTAAFSSALSGAGLSCNVVAGTNHDHIFVPVAEAESALDILRALQSRSC